MPSIDFIFRRKNPLFFSIEKVFDTILDETSRAGWKTERVEVPHYSTGILNVFKNIRWLRTRKADVYHVTGDIHYAVFAFPAKKAVVTIHDCAYVTDAKGLKRWVMHHLFLKWPVQYATVVTTISERSKADVIKYSGCKPDKVKVIPDPISGGITYSEKIFNAAKPILLFIGSTPNKNLPRVIEALEGISCHLEIVGKISEEAAGELKSRGISWAASHGLSEAALNQKYAEADILLFPTLFEGFGLPIVEAQQAGRVVITSDLPPMNEVAGGAACLVDPYNVQSIRQGIIKVISDHPYRAALLEAGKMNCQRFSTMAVSAQYLSLYQDVATR